MTLLAALLTACGGGAEGPVAPAPDVPPGIRIVSGELGSDTVDAILREPLTIEVSKASGPLAGLPVQFERIGAPGVATPTVAIAKPGEQVFQSSLTLTTDAQGRASVRLRLGAAVGDAYLRVWCAACNRADTIRYGVSTGNAAFVRATARDTSLIIGDSYVVRGSTYDRYGNRRTDPIDFVTGSPLVTVDSNGVVAVGASTGRGAIAVRSGALTDSARFVVTTGPTIAAVIGTSSAHQDSGGVIVTTTLNGLRERKFTYTGWEEAYPVPSPTADLVAYQRAAVGMQVFLVDGTGQNRRLVPPGRFIETELPRFSPDGRYVYFSARDSLGYGIWRAGVDGAGLTLITPVPSYQAPALSPDGRSLAYSGSDGMVVRSLVTGSQRLVGPTGSFPVFSPDGGRLAWLTGYDDVVVADADGSAFTRFRSVLKGPGSGLAWMDAGERLLTRGGNGVIAVDARTGAQTPLPKLGAYYQLFAQP